jgi:hypothetical protein
MASQRKPPGGRPGSGSQGGSKSASRRAAAARAAEIRAAQEKADRRRRMLFWSIPAVVVIGVVIAIVLIVVNNSNSPATSAQTDISKAVVTGPPGPEGIPLQQGTPLAGLQNAATGTTVDGIQCSAAEQTVYHVHTHLAVYVNGQLRPVAPGVGIVLPVAQPGSPPFYGATRCYYWLHVHAQDGVIHIESPTTRAYTLGQFFAIWGQPLSATQVGPATGVLTVYVNGRVRTGDPATIQLGSHEDIQIDVGLPAVPPKRVDWSNSQL